MPVVYYDAHGRPVCIDDGARSRVLFVLNVASVLAEALLAEGVCGEVTAELANGYRGVLMPARP